MELLAYVLAFFGFFLLIKGIKPTIVWINNITDKDLAKGVVIIAIFFKSLFLSIYYYKLPIVFVIFCKQKQLVLS